MTDITPVRLPPEHFPLYAIGVNIYGRMLSSPLLVAQTPEIAAQTVAMLNDEYRAAEAPAHKDDF